jgi:uncharacterized protein YndB with AHSA1/START domain
MEKGAPVAELRILFRVPVSKVFEAFVDPKITTKFWFTQSDGRLEPGKHLNWRWEKHDLTVPVQVLEVEQDKRIQMEWGEGDDKSTVEWTLDESLRKPGFLRIFLTFRQSRRLTYGLKRKSLTACPRHASKCNSILNNMSITYSVLHLACRTTGTWRKT